MFKTPQFRLQNLGSPKELKLPSYNKINNIIDKNSTIHLAPLRSPSLTSILNASSHSRLFSFSFLTNVVDISHYNDA